jgi:hypothetical protein
LKLWTLAPLRMAGVSLRTLHRQDVSYVMPSLHSTRMFCTKAMSTRVFTCRRRGAPCPQLIPTAKLTFWRHCYNNSWGNCAILLVMNLFPLIACKIVPKKFHDNLHARKVSYAPIINSHIPTMLCYLKCNHGVSVIFSLAYWCPPSFDGGGAAAYQRQAGQP